MAKIENFQFCTEYSAPTLRVKNCVEIALSLTVSEILTFFVFRKNSRWPPKVAKIEFFSISHRILCYYPTGQKFCRNRSISYGFQDINIFCFSAKIQDGRQKTKGPRRPLGLSLWKLSSKRVRFSSLPKLTLSQPILSAIAVL